MIVAIHGRALRQGGGQLGPERRDADLPQRGKDGRHQAVELAVVVRRHRCEYPFGERLGFGPGLRREGAEVVAGGAEHVAHDAAAVVDAAHDRLGQGHEAPHQVERQVRTRLGHALGNHRAREVEVAHEGGTPLPVDERPRAAERDQPLRNFGGDGLAPALAGQFEAQPALDGWRFAGELQQQAGQALDAERDQVLRRDGSLRSHVAALQAGRRRF